MTFDLHRHRHVLCCSPLHGMSAFSLQMIKHYSHAHKPLQKLNFTQKRKRAFE
nr:MAG TPA: hypothetical protein [Caudoviricetes sp.]